MGEWQPIEIAPQGVMVIVWNGDNMGLAEYVNWLAEGPCWCDDGEGLPYDPQPTHYMPLPEPPTT